MFPGGLGPVLRKQDGVKNRIVFFFQMPQKGLKSNDTRDIKAFNLKTLNFYKFYQFLNIFKKFDKITI